MNRKNVVAAALNNLPADLLLTGGKIIDVYTGTIYEGNIAVKDGIIAGIGNYTQGKQIIDLQGGYVAPGLINAHCHVESSMATPEAYCQEELRWGVTTLVTDPHEIANVAGIEGIKYMLQAGKNTQVNYYVQLPSCVPATPFEHAGCILNAQALAELTNDEQVLGLGEVMNVPGVLMQEQELTDKIDLFKQKNAVIDGHAPSVSGMPLQAYIASGIQTDHESTSWQEVKEKLRNGLAILIREGSASKNLTAIVKGLLEENIHSSNLAFCTDDKHLADIKAEGTIRHCIKKAVALGMQPVTAIQIATYYAAKIYNLKHLGAIAPGKQADIVVFNNLQDFIPQLVLAKGQNITQLNNAAPVTPPPNLLHSVNPAPFTLADFSADKFLDDKQYPVIEMIPSEILTECSYIAGDKIKAALKANELCLIAVIERHHQTGNIGLGLIKGYGIKNGAAATTVAHDSHNMIIIGTSPEAMFTAATELLKSNGGYTIVENTTVLRTLPLPICGLMSDKPADKLITELEEIKHLAHQQGVQPAIDPFISLSFMALPVIPKIRITDMGMFDTVNFKFI